MRVLPGPTKSNQVLAWSPDGRFVVAGGTGDGVMVWDADGLAQGRRVLMSGHGGRILRFCPRTGWLYVAFQGGGLWHWEPDTGAEVIHDSTGGPVYYHNATISADAQWVVAHCYRSGSHEFIGLEVTDAGLREVWTRPNPKWQLAPGFALRSLDELFGVTYTPQRFEWGPATADEPAGVLPLPPESGAVRHWSLAPDGERVAWACARGLHLARLDGSAAQHAPAPEGALLRGLAWSPDGRTLAYAARSVVHLLDADAFTELRALDWGTGNARAICFSPDGLRAAVSAEGGKGWVTVFDLE